MVFFFIEEVISPLSATIGPFFPLFFYSLSPPLVPSITEASGGHGRRTRTNSFKEVDTRGTHHSTSLTHLATNRRGETSPAWSGLLSARWEFRNKEIISASADRSEQGDERQTASFGFQFVPPDPHLQFQPPPSVFAPSKRVTCSVSQSQSWLIAAKRCASYQRSHRGACNPTECWTKAICFSLS